MFYFFNLEFEVFNIYIYIYIMFTKKKDYFFNVGFEVF